MWYQEPRWRPRLLVETALMKERFPAFVLKKDSAGRLAYEGMLEPEKPYAFRVSLTFPATYPYTAPVARLIDPPLEAGAPHVYAADLSLCVHHAVWNPELNTLAGTVPLVSSWLALYLTWLETGEIF